MAKLATKGTLLQKEVSSVYTTIAQRVKLTGPTANMGAMEITDLDSLMEERGPTIVNPGTISGTFWFDPNEDTHTAFIDDMLAGTVANYKLVFPDGMTTPACFTLAGFPTKFEPTGMEAKGYLQAEFEVTCDGTLFTYTPGAA